MRWSVLLLAFAAPAFACSVTEVAAPASLVTRADTIVLAMAVGYEPPSAAFDKNDASTFYGRVSFQTIETLKGTSPTRVVLAGQTQRYKGANKGTVPYTWARPGASGACHAYDYKIGALFLLFLKNGRADWAALAATNEEVIGADDAWLAWVRAQLKKP